MAGYYAVTSNREFIGGPYPFMFQASSWDGFAFGRPINAIPTGEFLRYLETYNIKWVIAHSAGMKKYLESIPEVILADESGPLRAYRVQQSASYFLRGSGTVKTRGINRLVLEGLEGPEIIIKYHYVRGLTASPPARIEPYWVTGIEQPFIRLTEISGTVVELSLP
jgi:hypothetical protein